MKYIFKTIDYKEFTIDCDNIIKNNDYTVTIVNNRTNDIKQLKLMNFDKFDSDLEQIKTIKCWDTNEWIVYFDVNFRYIGTMYSIPLFNKVKHLVKKSHFTKELLTQYDKHLKEDPILTDELNKEQFKEANIKYDSILEKINSIKQHLSKDYGIVNKKEWKELLARRLWSFQYKMELGWLTTYFADYLNYTIDLLQLDLNKYIKLLMSELVKRMKTKELIQQKFDSLNLNWLTFDEAIHI